MPSYRDSLYDENTRLRQQLGNLQVLFHDMAKWMEAANNNIDPNCKDKTCGYDQMFHLLGRGRILAPKPQENG